MNKLASRDDVTTVIEDATEVGLTSLLERDHLEIKQEFDKYARLTGPSAATAKRRENLAARISDVVEVALRVRHQVLYPAAIAAGVPAEIWSDAWFSSSSALCFLPLSGEMPRDDLVIGNPLTTGRLVRLLFEHEAEHLLPACRKAGLDRTIVAAQLAIRRIGLQVEVKTKKRI